MHISSMKLQGFKSFLHETELHFQKGIMAVVGPNGCGKSNLVDAIKWAIGEQSPKRLRAKHMEEILFNGSEDCPPTGMARVCLLFSCEGGGFPEPYSQLNELSVERIYYRSGESEYRINRLPVRLKDVLELFMDTGTGAKAYSIIEQGYIGEIVSSNAEQRRIFIEEAAGIMKYKSRKVSALRKMEATKENLRHIEAVISEVHRQMNCLKRQAQKARRYYEIKEEIKRLETIIAVKEYCEITEESAKAKKIQEDNLSKETSLRTAMSQEEVEIEELRLRITDWTKHLDTLQQKITSFSQELDKKENEQAYLQRSLDDLGKRSDEVIDKVHDAHLQLKLLTEEEKVLDRKLQEHLKRDIWLRESFKEAENHNNVLILKEKELRKTLEEERNQLFGCLTRLSEVRNAQTSSIEKKTDLESRRAKGQHEIIFLSEENNRLKDSILRMENEKDCFLEQRSFAQMERSVYEMYQEVLGEKQNEQVRLLESLQELLHKRASRLHSLLDLQNNYEGCQEGVRAIMRRKTYEEAENTGILGMVGDVIATSPEYETALESVLGEKLQYIIIQNHKDGLEAIDYLKSYATGRGSFIPLHLRLPNLNGAFRHESDEGISLLDYVKVKEGYQTIADYLLGDVYLVPDLNAALDLWEKNGNSNTLVTKEGEIVNPYGVITGGSINGSGAHILKNNREIRDLEEEVGRIQVDFEKEKGGYEKALRKMRLAETDLEHLNRQHYDLDMEILRKEKDVQKLQEVLYINEQRLKIICFENEQYENQIQELSNVLDTYFERRAYLEREKDERESIVSSLSHTYGDVLIDKELQAEAWNTLEMEIRLLEERIRQQKVDLETLRTQTSELERSILEENTRMETINCQMNTLKLQMEENDQHIRNFANMRMNEEENVNHCRCKMGKELEKSEIKEVTVKRIRKELEVHFEEGRENNLRIAEMELKKKNICDRVWGKYQIQLEGEIENYKEEEEGSRPQEQVRMELEKSYRYLEKLGEVNPNAIEEFDDLNKRYIFYKNQYDDLTKTLDSLQRLIQRINRITRNRFLDAFGGINTRFQEIFPKLFNGGKASLQLSAADNVLETGIEIIAQPPGKKLQNINLLSGGEKALAAIALIFAIFQYKPCPFCLLDEVDAALDDVNIHRFNDLIKEMANASQLVLVTHNKQSMEIADTLFGVLMESPGVSKVVSVRMQ